VHEQIRNVTICEGKVISAFVSSTVKFKTRWNEGNKTVESHIVMTTATSLIESRYYVGTRGQPGNNISLKTNLIF